jgi:hypothetical protein
MMFEVNVYAQLNPSSALEVRAVAEARMKTPVSADGRAGNTYISSEWDIGKSGLTCGQGKCTFTPEERQLNKVARDERARDASNAQYDSLRSYMCVKVQQITDEIHEHCGR